MVPRLSSRRTYMLNIPELSGGTNLRDGISHINDNQLIDSKNMVYKNGLLRTRKGIKPIGPIYNFVEPVVDVKIYQDINFTYSDNYTTENFVLCVTEMLMTPQETVDYGITFFSDTTGENIIVGTISTNIFRPTTTILPIKDKDNIYFLVKTVEDKYHLGSIYYNCYKATYSGKKTFDFQEINNIDDIGYIPVISTNGVPSVLLDNLPSNSGTQIRATNILSPYYKMIYSSVNPNSVNSSEAKYPLLYPVKHNTTIKATFLHPSGKITTHSVNITEDGTSWLEEERNSQDTLKMAVEENNVVFYDTNDKIAKFGTALYVFNNLEITASFNNDIDFERVFSMTQYARFGGAAEGLSGGTRLFLGGNTSNENRHLVIWSEFDNPLYFPENNNFYVGDSGEKVTGFGKQNDSLIIFKEHEVYYTKYATTTLPTAEQIENQSVIDVTVTGVTFPLVQINTNIGCDCPDTIQLCKNKLVWLTSDGKVYCLTSQNQYSERNIFCVSEMIERKIKEHAIKDLRNAKSADYNGLYILSIDSQIYCMDYNSYGYNYIYSYSKTEDANKLIPWYIWKFANGFDILNLYTRENSLFIAADYFLVSQFYTLELDSGVDEYMAQINNDNDKKSIPIDSMVQTKAYDFGQPAMTKDVQTVSFSFGYNGGFPIEIRFITEQGDNDVANIIIDGENCQNRDAKYLSSYDIYPYSRSNVRFGVKIQCNGNLEINSISFKYKILGGVKWR